MPISQFRDELFLSEAIDYLATRLGEKREYAAGTLLGALTYEDITAISDMGAQDIGTILFSISVSPQEWEKIDTAIFLNTASVKNELLAGSSVYRSIRIKKEDIDVWLHLNNIRLTHRQNEDSLDRGRPSSRGKVYQALNNLPQKDAFFRKSRSAQASEIAHKCGHTLEDRGWGERALIRHITRWKKDQDQKE